MKFLIIYIILFLTTVNCEKVSFIKPCYARDTACLKSSAQRAVPIVAEGISSLNIHRLDPMYVDHVTASEAGLSMDFRNTIVKGLRRCKVTDLRRSQSQTTLELKCSVVLIGDYTLAGKLLMLPIEGEGKYKINIRDIVVNVALDIGERVAGGERYWIVKHWKHRADVLGGVHFQFQNLFHGNKELSDPIHNFANSNWHQIFQEVAPPIVKAIVTRTVHEITKLFDRVPIKYLALD